MANKKILVPSLLFGDAETRFTQAGLDILYVLPNELRGLGGDDKTLAKRKAAYDANFKSMLPQASVLSGLELEGKHLLVTEEILGTAPNLEVVFVPAAGYDKVDLAACTKKGIVVVNAAGCNYRPVAELTIGLMLSLARKIAITDRAVHREAQYINALQLPGGIPTILQNKVLGLIGFGNIGREVARICTIGFGMRILAYDPYFSPIEAERLGVQLIDSLKTLLIDSDYVSVHSPMNEATRHLIGWDELVSMKSTAYLLNTSRGGTVDTDALVRALREGQIAGAGLDVTDPEPLPDGHPLFALDNVILTSHCGGAAPETMLRAGSISANDVLRALRGKRPLNLVNPDVWSTYLKRLK
jgi:D-3-phosphoglycerate dehydrogenase